MKSLILILLTFIFLIPNYTEAKTQKVDHSELDVHFKKGKRTKSGAYKKKRGLFRKKNGCDCPKH
jgi:hypothetical protein